MGKEEKEDTGFGFKDKAKAVETLRLLETHDLNYRRLTVRGLLGRAKRVLSLTKADEKIKNIKEAMEVFETWLSDLDKNKEKKSEDKPSKRDQKTPDNKGKEDQMDVDDKEDSGSEDSLPSESVSGLGFKDRAAAEGSISVLEGRDPDYQLLAVKGLVGRAKRVLTCTRDESKLSNIKEAISVLEQFVEQFEERNLRRENCAYLNVGYVRTAHRLAGSVTEEQKSFLSAYESVKGEYKRLRNVRKQDGGQTWDIVRNNALKELKQKNKDSKMFNEKREPSKEHLEYILWAYSPDPVQLKKVIQYTKEENSDKPEKAESKPEKKEKAEKRKRSNSSDESPSKKKK